MKTETILCTAVSGDPFGLIAPGHSTDLRTLVFFGRFFRFDEQARMFTPSQGAFSQLVPSQLSKEQTRMQTDERVASIRVLDCLAGKYSMVLTKARHMLGIPLFSTSPSAERDVIIDVQFAVDDTFGMVDFAFTRLKSEGRAHIPNVLPVPERRLDA